MNLVKLEVILDGWNRRKILEDPLTKKKYYPELNGDIISFSGIDPHYALTLINASPRVFKLIEGKLPDMAVPKIVKPAKEEDSGKPFEKMTYRQLQAKYAELTGGSPAGKKKDEILEALQNVSTQEKVE